MRHIKVVASALAIGLILLMATDYVAMAATGRPLVLGTFNKVGATTTVKSAKGPALKLATQPGEPPLKVNRKSKVKKLNADFVDGKTSAELGVQTRSYSRSINLTSVVTFAASTPSIPAGNYLLTLSGVLDFPSNSDVECVASSDGSTSNFVDVYTSTDARGFASLNAAGLATLKTSHPIKVECFSSVSGDITSQPLNPLKVAVTSISSLTTGAIGSPS